MLHIVLTVSVNLCDCIGCIVIRVIFVCLNILFKKDSAILGGFKLYYFEFAVCSHNVTVKAGFHNHMLLF